MTSPQHANAAGRKLFGRQVSVRGRRGTLLALALLAFLSMVIAVRSSIGTPDENSVWQVIVILAALPWSLALVWLDLVGGFGDRAAWIVAVGFALNVSLLFVVAWAVARRLRHHSSRRSSV